MKKESELWFGETIPRIIIDFNCAHAFPDQISCDNVSVKYPDSVPTKAGRLNVENKFWVLCRSECVLFAVAFITSEHYVCAQAKHGLNQEKKSRGPVFEGALTRTTVQYCSLLQFAMKSMGTFQCMRTWITTSRTGSKVKW